MPWEEAVKEQRAMSPKGARNGSAEWNIYNNPEAAEVVVTSGIPITLVPLDVTNILPVNVKFLKRMEGVGTSTSRLVRGAYQVIYDLIEKELYYF